MVGKPMRNVSIAVAGFIVLFMVLIGAVVADDEGPSGEGLAGAVDEETAPLELRRSEPVGELEGEDPLRARIRALSVSEKVAQLMVVRLHGTPGPNAHDRMFLREYPPGGVVLPSLMRPANVAGYVESIRALAPEVTHGIPAFIAADMHRLPKQGRGLQSYFPPMPSPLALAAASDADLTRALVGRIAESMTTMGINMYFGPALMLASNVPGVEGAIHSMGGDPEFVTATGKAFVEALHEHQIIAAPTGFPGGGFNTIDGAPAVLTTPEASVRSMDLLPYRAAIEAGAPMIHVGNTLTPTIDRRNFPASISDIVIHDLLRKELGYEGVVLVGPYDAPEITRAVDVVEATLHALRSGADMILWDTPGQRVVRTIELVARAVQQGELDESVIDSALERVLRLKHRYGLVDRPRPRARDVQRLERRRARPEEAIAIERKSITLAQNRNNVLPLSQPASQPVGVTGVVGVEALHEALEKHLKRVARQDIASARHGGRIYDFEISRLTRYSRGVQTFVVILTNEIRPEGVQDLISEVHSVGARVVVVLLGYPRRLPDLSDADAIVVAYDPAGTDQTMRAVSDVLMGNAPMKILPPVRDLTVQAGVSSTFSVYDVVRAPSGRLPVTIADPFVAGLGVPYDPTGAIRRAQWDFGDGSRSRELVTEKSFSEPGEYTITLTITDTQGDTVQERFFVMVEE